MFRWLVWVQKKMLLHEVNLGEALYIAKPNMVSLQSGTWEANSFSNGGKCETINLVRNRAVLIG